MPKKFNDYYDYDNKVQHKPQTWQCPKCEYKIEVLSANDVSHPCPKNDQKVTFFKNIDQNIAKKSTKKATKKVTKKATKTVAKKVIEPVAESVKEKIDNELSI
jgi:transcription initiation factor IIE alpha subunit